MLLQGLEFMVAGMGVVFCFLGLMVICMYASAEVVAAYTKKFPGRTAALKSSAGQPVYKHDEVAVAIAAVRAYIKS